jgi:hypothetical protein
MSKLQALVRTLLVASLAVTFASPATLAAQKKPARKPANQYSEAFFRCKDEQGHSIMGQSIPPECMEADVDVLDKTGRVVRTIPGRRSQEQLNQQKADADAVQAAGQRDRTLLATYLSVADIERLRDSRLEQLDQQVLVTRQYITNLRAREARLMQDVQRYHPYSSKANAPVLPEALAAEIVNTVNGLRVYEQELLKNMSDQQQLRAEFDADITRFKELKAAVQR